MSASLIQSVQLSITWTHLSSSVSLPLKHISVIDLLGQHLAHKLEWKPDLKAWLCFILAGHYNSRQLSTGQTELLRRCRSYR